ncbi:MAG: RnfABCDGE type electron transport complex subunit B [Christensenellaceae bacterium]|nr:RnfABCDGE type electron transport complex subunit B [Christensenellaceae bacterium]
MLDAILWPLIALGGIGLVLGLGLAIASKIFEVKVDPKVEQVRELLPGANCGGCGFPGCDGFAKAVAAGEREAGACVALSCDNLAAIGALLGVDTTPSEPKVARVRCHGDSENCISKYTYTGIHDCRAAAMLAGGPSACAFGCVGLLTCGKACPFGAIYLSDKGIAAVDESLCTGCGRCEAICPKHVITVMPKSRRVFVACRTNEKGKAAAAICKAGCIACGLCAKKCPEGAITMKDNLPVIDYEKCTGCGVCVSVCPKGSIAINDEKNVNICAG